MLASYAVFQVTERVRHDGDVEFTGILLRVGCMGARYGPETCRCKALGLSPQISLVL